MDQSEPKQASSSVVEDDAPSKGFDYDERDLESDETLWALYERWKIHYDVPRDLEEMQKRFGMFKETARGVYNFNKLKFSYQLGLNAFGDMSDEEFAQLYLGGVQDDTDSEEEYVKVEKEIDYTSIPGYISAEEVKDACLHGIRRPKYPKAFQGDDKAWEQVEVVLCEVSLENQEAFQGDEAGKCEAGVGRKQAVALQEKNLENEEAFRGDEAGKKEKLEKDGDQVKVEEKN